MKSTTTATTTAAADGGHTKHCRRSRHRRRPLPLPWLVPAATASTATGAVDDTDTSTAVDDAATSMTDAAHRRLYAPPSPVSPSSLAATTSNPATAEREGGRSWCVGPGGGQKRGGQDER